MTEAFTIVNSQLSMVEALEAVQRAAFPTLAEDEIITAAHYAAHIARFPEGQFTVLNAAGQVVACSTDFRTVRWILTLLSIGILMPWPTIG